MKSNHMRSTGDYPGSLFRRLLLGFMAVMLGAWLCLLAWNYYETHLPNKKDYLAGDRSQAKEYLIFIQPFADNPGDIQRITELWADQNQRDRGDEYSGEQSAQIQVWQRDRLAYASSSRGLPKEDPAAGAPPPGESLQNNSSWASWVEADPATNITVKITSKVAGGWAAPLGIKTVGYYLLPLAYSFPLLLLPAWFFIRIGLRPLQTIGTEIAERSEANLSPLAPSSYKELSPLVISVNRLLERLSARLQREKEFLVDAAHELKTPLALIEANADALSSASAPQRVMEARDGLTQGVSRASHTVHQLLALARSDSDPDPTNMQTMNLVELVRDRLAPAAHVAMQRRIDIEFLAPESCMLPLHRESISALVDNLINNAMKYSADNSRIVVSIVADSGSTRLSVTDEGPGIPAELRKKVFERFFRVPGLDQVGSGLGLAIAEKAAARNNARIYLEAGVGDVGLVAVVEFPVEEGG